MHEALWLGGRGWLDYDRLFHQQAALDPTLAWNSLPSLVASTILGQRSRGDTFSGICQGVDHLPPQCARAYLHQPTRVDMTGRHGQSGSSVCWSWNEASVHTCTTPDLASGSRSVPLAAVHNTGPGTAGTPHQILVLRGVIPQPRVQWPQLIRLAKI